MREVRSWVIGVRLKLCLGVGNSSLPPMMAGQQLCGHREAARTTTCVRSEFSQTIMFPRPDSDTYIIKSCRSSRMY